MALKFGAKKSTGGKASSNKTKSFAGFEYKKRDDSKMIQRATRRVSGGDSWVSDEVRFFSPKEGDHEIRILPPTWEDADHFGIDVWLHYGIGPDRSSYLCPAKMKDESCPLCDERVKAQQAGEDEYADLFSPRPRVAFFVIDRKEEKAGPLLWAPSANTEKEIVNAARDRKTNSVVSLDDPSKDGYDLSFSIEGSGIKTKYKSIQTRYQQIYRRSGSSDYFVYSLADQSLQLAAKGAQTGELSPDGKLFGYELGGDLYVRDLSTDADRRLTTGATETLFNGRFDWVYEEEFGMAQAWNWSPDSRHLAYWQVDASAEPVIQLTDYEGRHPEWDRLRIPQPGDSNPTVRIGVVNVATGAQVWLDTGATGDFYIPRIYWTSSADTLAVLELNRKQNTLRLFFFNVNDAGRRLVRTWTSDTWLDVYDFYAGIQDMMTFPARSREFFWISDQDGWQHIYRYDYSGKLIKQVTSGPWTVTRIEGTDPERKLIYYSSTEVSPLQRQLYVVGFDGKGKRRLTTTAGTHAIDMGPNSRYYIDRWSSTTQPRQVELWAAGDRKVKTLEDNAAVTTWLTEHAYSPDELFQFTTSDGQVLDGSMIKPPDFDPSRKYPVILAIYGGPGSQQVYDRFASSGIDQWRAQQGYIVVGLNNRGSNNYGSAFMKQVYRSLGKYEGMDFAEAARWLAKQPWVDGSRIAIDGTSYGGYSVLYTMAAYPDAFAAGIANSAVTDWRLYDTIYAERYMDLLEDNAAGYDSAAVNPRAGRITGRLLVIHSMMDDNVHPVNTMQFLTAATNAGVDAELRIYPPGRHGAAYNFPSFRMIMEVSDDFLARTIGAGRPAVGATP